jgi:hypothetical protein
MLPMLLCTIHMSHMFHKVPQENVVIQYIAAAVLERCKIARSNKY